MGDAGSPGCLHVATTAADRELVADRCWLLGATAVGEAGAVLEVGFETVGDAKAAAWALGEWRADIGVAVVDAAPALEAALAAWKPYARPVRVGRLHVRPAWLDPADDPPSEGERVVVVDPTRAFGYDHPSTMLCLAQVERLARPGVAALDVGCGSGVLAIAAAALGAGPVVAVDTDPIAASSASAAADTNGVDVAVSTTPVHDIDGRFDLVVANIGAGTLGALAPAIAARVDVGGHLILAGLLGHQADDVTAAYVAQGLARAGLGERDGWVSPVLARKPKEIHHF